MTTATATFEALNDVLDDRWRMATTRCELDNRAPAIPSSGNSKAMTRLMTSLETIAGRMVGEVHTSEEDAWDALQYDLLTSIENKIKDFALQIEQRRATQ